ncbi:GPW/gp25 family protein [Fodinicola acaciae]|uniref:GPW/gp25 family protein n=1 Tax=Fodinicola acaciae TaxID=2681555 RepID=UPI0013D79895|nr:GPW/gp25 family protein [Fodinicola acaciae]
MRHEFIGSGWAFPVRTDATGSIALVSGEREVAESIRLILATVPGERPMRPAFGCNIHDLVFAPADAATAGQIAYEVRIALDRWEPRIVLDDVIISFDRVEDGMLLIDIRYRLRDTNDPRNLVFPFYTIPAHEGPDGISAEDRPAEIAAATDAVALSKGDA